MSQKVGSLELTIIQMDREEASRRHQGYTKIKKNQWEAEQRLAKRIYWHLKRGRKVLDVQATFTTAQLNEQGDPRLAVAPAYAKTIHFHKWYGGGGRLDLPGLTAGGCKATPKRDFVSFPPGTFTWPRGADGHIARGQIRTQVPMIPPEHLPKGELTGNYHLLWEVQNWDELPRDPLLMRRISDRIFVVVDNWDLTEVERLVLSMAMGGR